MATIRTSLTFDVAVLEYLFKRPPGPSLSSIEDFLRVAMHDLADQEVVVDETGIEEVTPETFDRQRIDYERLRDANDDYDSILFYSKREIKVESN